MITVRRNYKYRPCPLTLQVKILHMFKIIQENLLFKFKYTGLSIYEDLIVKQYHP